MVLIVRDQYSNFFFNDLKIVNKLQIDGGHHETVFEMSFLRDIRMIYFCTDQKNNINICCFEVLYCIWMHPGGDFVYFIIIFNSRLFIIILYRMLRFAYIITINGHSYHAVPCSYFIQCICTNFNEFFWIALKYFCCVYICEIVAQ